MLNLTFKGDDKVVGFRLVCLTLIFYSVPLCVSEPVIFLLRSTFLRFLKSTIWFSHWAPSA